MPTQVIGRITREAEAAQVPPVRQEVQGTDEAGHVVLGGVQSARVSDSARCRAGRCPMRTRRSEGWAYRRNGVWYVAFYVDGKKVRESTGCTKPPKETFTDEKGKHVEVPPLEVKRILRDRMNALD